MRLLVDTESLTRSKKGTTFGLVYFETEGGPFPSKGWTDLAPALVRAWLEALIKIASETSKRETVWFMDGPYAVELSANGPGFTEVRFVHRTEKGRIVLHSTRARTVELLQNALSEAEQVRTKYRQNDWTDNDTEPLVVAAKQGAKMLAKLLGRVARPKRLS